MIKILAMAMLFNTHSFHGVRVDRVIDGDTISMHIEGVHPLLGESIPIRVNGIDTPELNSKDKCAKRVAIQAKRYTQLEVLTSKTITLRSCKRDSFFRLICDVDLDGRSLASLLFKKALAVPYDGKRKSVNWCSRKG